MKFIKKRVIEIYFRKQLFSICEYPIKNTLLISLKLNLY